MESMDEQAEAAMSAARARGAIAEKIATLIPDIEGEAEAQLILLLSQAYANLAAEPPRARAT
jgi:hypothetical protein